MATKGKWGVKKDSDTESNWWKDEWKWVKFEGENSFSTHCFLRTADLIQY